MSNFARINLSALPAPPVIEALNVEVILGDLKSDLIARAPELATYLDLESEPLLKLLEVFAWRELILRQRVNDAARAVMLPFATGGDLDNLAAIFGAERRVIDPGDAQVVPPVLPVLESDDEFRYRAQIALEAQSTAGPQGAYTFWTLAADPDIRDAYIGSPSPGVVEVTILSRSGDGTASPALIATVLGALNDEDVRPLTDFVIVQGASIMPYSVDATLTLFDGPDSAVVLAAAEAALDLYIEDSHAMGRDVTISGLHAALHQPGVHRVVLAAPVTDLIVAPTEASYCATRTVTFGGRDA